MEPGATAATPPHSPSNWAVVGTDSLALPSPSPLQTPHPPTATEQSRRDDATKKPAAADDGFIDTADPIVWSCLHDGRRFLRWPGRD